MKRARKQARGGARSLKRVKKRQLEAENNSILGKILNFHITLPILEESCPLAVSTRGIGFMLSKVTNFMKECYPKMTSEIPLSAMYRASLAQLEAKIYFSRDKQTRPMSLRTSSEESCLEIQPQMSHNRAQILRANRTNLSQIVFMINSIGHFVCNGMHFEPIFTAEKSPINLRITNLREYCIEMSDTKTEPAKRIVGYELNSIPNAIWARKNDDDKHSIVLTNPDDIIPPDYNNHMLMGDLMKTLSYVQRISGKRPDCRDLVNYENDGDSGLLVSTNVISGKCLRLDEKNQVQSGDVERNFWSRENVDHYSWCAGAATLAGEVFNSSIVPHRSKILATHECRMTWDTIADSLYSLEYKK